MTGPLPTRDDELLSEVGLFVEYLASDYDLTELLHVLVERCVQLFDVDATGLILAGASGHLQVMAATAGPATALELFQIQSDEGPCLDCFRSAGPVLVDDIAADGRWPSWGPAAAEAGFQSVAALPLTAKGECFGALNMFGRTTMHLTDAPLAAAQILANVASVVIVHERSRQRDETIIEQLQTALDSRVVIEQAKGVIAERQQIGLDVAFEQLRSYARSHGMRIAALSNDIVTGRRVLPSG